jgi:hypothetical protein
MYSEFRDQIAQDRVADLHRRARRDALARAARQGRRTHKPQSGHRVPRLPAIAARRVRTVWGTHT